jgi:type IV pilus assembly protein PilX
MKNKSISVKSQRGVALFVGLMLLLVLTLLGLSASQGSIMQERMAGNVANANLAFQQAERTLRRVEQRLIQHIMGGAGGLGFMPPTWDETGLERSDCTMSGYDWDNAFWRYFQEDGGGFIVVDLSDYMVGEMPYGSSCRPAAESGGSAAGEYYLIVARGTADSGASTSIVQSIFFWPQ